MSARITAKMVCRCDLGLSKTSPMYKQTMDIQQQRVDAARAARQEKSSQHSQTSKDIHRLILLNHLAPALPINCRATSPQEVSNANV